MVSMAPTMWALCALFRQCKWGVREMIRERSLSDMFIRVTVELVKLGDQSPYFSVTGDEWANKGMARIHPENPQGCGQLHDDILRAWPGLADVIALHLSDIDGVPMHAVENGWYFFEREEMDTLASHLRVSVEDIPGFASKAAFAVFVDAQRDRWAREAKAAIEKYGLTITTK